jgi:hypothetical protein
MQIMETTCYDGRRQQVHLAPHSSRPTMRRGPGYTKPNGLPHT